MKSITSKISVITLSLLACTFTFVLGTTSSKAVGDGNSFEQCVGRLQMVRVPGLDEHATYLELHADMTVRANAYNYNQIIGCAKK
ncbi:MAG TPA: hypothetical protein DCL66_07790 [Gammaproteobacteria bacterium]|nr:hypothetical protein [Gammaproteobacteria bacterium]